MLIFCRMQFLWYKVELVTVWELRACLHDPALTVYSALPWYLAWARKNMRNRGRTQWKYVYLVFQWPYQKQAKDWSSYHAHWRQFHPGCLWFRENHCGISHLAMTGWYHFCNGRWAETCMSTQNESCTGLWFPGEAGSCIQTLNLNQQ